MQQRAALMVTEHELVGDARATDARRGPRAESPDTELRAPSAPSEPLLEPRGALRGALQDQRAPLSPTSRDRLLRGVLQLAHGEPFVFGAFEDAGKLARSERAVAAQNPQVVA